MIRYRKKPIVVEAIRFDGYNHRILLSWSDGAVVSAKPHKVDYFMVQVETLEGTMDGVVGDWIIKGVKGEFYPCKPDIFEATYEKMNND